MTTVVLDSTVVSVFHTLGKLDLLKKLLNGNTVMIASAVHRELLPINPPKLFYEKEPSPSAWIRVIDIETEADTPLGLGEEATLTLAKKHHAIAVLDDLQARRSAKKRNIPYTGTLALLKKGRADGTITQKELENIITRLQQEKELHLTPELVEWTLTP